MDKFVNLETSRKIRLGDRVIKEVKDRLVFGAGNQVRFGPGAPERKAEAELRTNLAMRTRDMRLGKDPKTRQMGWVRPQELAGSALAFGAGNCQEQAALAYLYLREMTGAMDIITFCQQPGEHAFAAIGDPVSDPANQVVIVDPWPTRAQAVLFEDHFTFGNQIEWLLKKPGGKPNRIQHAEGKYLEVNVEFLLESARAQNYFGSYRNFQVTYATKDNSTIHYRDEFDPFYSGNFPGPS